jgi:hypothetical protein
MPGADDAIIGVIEENVKGMKSVSALTIYAVMHGYVDINNI